MDGKAVMLTPDVAKALVPMSGVTHRLSHISFHNLSVEYARWNIRWICGKMMDTCSSGWTCRQEQVGAHLIYEGFLREGLSVCKAIRDRHDGFKRNPYNEFECGNHYARSMANYAYLLALSGFRYSAPQKTLYFDPVIFRDNFQTFFSVDSGWGIIKQRHTAYGKVVTIEVLEGELELEKVVLGGKEVVDKKIRLMSGASETLVLHR